MRLLHNRAHRIAAAAAVVVLALGAGACGDSDDDDEAATSTTTTAEGPPEGGGEERTIDLEAKDFEFAPTESTAPAGAEVTVKLRNTGAAPHTFTIAALGVDEQVAAGETGEATFTMPDTGNVDFVCRFHEGQGMKGTVEPG